jgi:transketolase
VFSISCDLSGSTGLKAFQKAKPDRYIDVGIAESNMVSVAAGMSKAGFIPVVDTFAAFGITKGNLPLIMAQLSECPLIAVFSHTGFQDAADGASHQSLTYMSAVASIPGVVIVNLATAKEAEAYVYQAIVDIKNKREKNEHASSYIFFLGRENFSLETKAGLTYHLEEPQVIQSGSEGVIVSTGSLLEEALKAASELEKKGKKVSVIHHPFANSKKVDVIASELKKTKGNLVTVEDHQVIGGMGAMLTHHLKLKGCTFKVQSLGVQGLFGQSSYLASELYEKHGLDSKAIQKVVESWS